jgi:hypothetical protein
MELTDDLLIALFVAWRADIDSEPFAHELLGLISAPLPAYLTTCGHPGDHLLGPAGRLCWSLLSRGT